ncbi:MAG: hypothetical protein CL609_10695 [Anaerolineaceae bacterium]|nr:hypothetical protein [Anaerolineaceae bacterium]
MINNDQLAEYLITDFHYKKLQADEIVNKILKMDEKILASFYVWYQTGEFLNEPIVAGFDPLTLSKLVPLKPPAIFLLLDWIKREPEEALKAMHYEYGLSTESISEDK